MRKEIIYELESAHRDDLRVTAYHFGKGKKSVCILGALRGNEVQQMYICSRLVKQFKELEACGKIKEDHEIVVIPSVNHYAMNIKKRFWAVDNTDINRMFPGYDKGETTQRIAAAVFDYVKEYTYGIQFSSFYMEGEFMPHVRQMATGYQNAALAKAFGLKYVLIRTPKPFDTTTLNYNWQVWNTNAFSIYTYETKNIKEDAADVGVEAVLRFLAKVGIIEGETAKTKDIKVLQEDSLKIVKSPTGGIYRRVAGQGDLVKKGDVLARVIHPYEGEVLAEITAPADGEIFFAYRSQLVTEEQILFKMIG